MESHFTVDEYLAPKNCHFCLFFRFRCPPEFVYLYREFGGNLWLRDSRQRLPTEISDRAPALELMKQLQGKIVDLNAFNNVNAVLFCYPQLVFGYYFKS